MENLWFNSCFLCFNVFIFGRFYFIFTLYCCSLLGKEIFLLIYWTSKGKWENDCQARRTTKSVRT